MSTAIVYISKHGTTNKVALLLKEKSKDSMDLIDLRKDQKPDLSLYDTVIIGGSIHAGMIQKQIKKFCELNGDLLLQRTLGLFLCCMYEEESALKQFNIAYPDKLRNHAKATGLLGGEFIFERMNFFEKLIVKKVSGFKETVSKINMDEVNKFALKMAIK